MDEVGRGTTVQDGLAIAFATIHHLVTVNGCRALFATHFHELADMLGCTEDNKGQGVFENVSFFCTDIDESPVSGLFCQIFPFLSSFSICATVKSHCLLLSLESWSQPQQSWFKSRTAGWDANLCRISVKSCSSIHEIARSSNTQSLRFSVHAATYPRILKHLTTSIPITSAYLLLAVLLSKTHNS